MTQQQNTGLVESLQSEVAKEASPLLEFLIRNARKIFLALLGIILVIVALGIWNYYSSSKLNDARDELGMIIVQPKGQAKTAALEAFVAKAPDELKPGALLALALSADSDGNYDKAASAWSQFSALSEGKITFIAKYGEASALARGGKTSEALKLFESMQGGLSNMEAVSVNLRIVDLAEIDGNIDRAIRACEDIINAEITAESKPFWEQRLNWLKQKKATATGNN